MFAIHIQISYALAAHMVMLFDITTDHARSRPLGVLRKTQPVKINQQLKLFGKFFLISPRIDKLLYFA